MQAPINILVVEDDIINFTTFKLLLNSSKFKIATITNTTTLADTIAFLKNAKPDIIFLDLHLPDCNRLESFKALEKFTSQIATVVLSANTDIDTSIGALSLGAEDYLVKNDFNIKILDKTILYSIERKKAKIQAISLEKKYKQIFYENSMPMLIVDNITHAILECNNASIREYGYARNKFLKLSIKDIWVTNDISKAINNLKNTNQNTVLLKNVLKHKTKNGNIIFVNATICDVEYENKLVRQIQVQNVTPQILLQKALKKEQKDKEFLIRKAANLAQETERKNIGTELHENVSQILAASLLYLDNFIASERLNKSMAINCKEHIATAMKEINALSRNLIPPIYIEEDFIGSLNEILIPIKKLNTLQIKTTINNSLNQILNTQQKLAIFRIVQEQLNNILKHACATIVTISIGVIDNQVTLLITDNGKGCILKKSKKGLGLQNIISRAELFNGTAKFISEMGNGFEVLVSFKLI